MKTFIALTLTILLGSSSTAFALVATEAVPVVQGMPLPAGEGTPCPCNTDVSTINSVQEERTAAVFNALLPGPGAAPVAPTPSSGTDTSPGG